MNLWEMFLGPEHRRSVKYRNYFPIYEQYFGPWVDRPVRFLELGVWHGGSLQLWKRYFGPLATIVGIDMHPPCAFSEDQISVRIGLQQDTAFLQSVCDEFGPFDIVLDDCSHAPWAAVESFKFLYPRMATTGLYVIEDTGLFHTDPVFEPMLMECYRKMNEFPPAAAHSGFAGIYLYQYMVIFDRCPLPFNTTLEIGELRIL